MNFTCKVKMNNANQIIKDHGLDDNGTVTKFLRNTVDRFCDPYIPFKTGPLKNNKQYPNNHSIKYVSPYAHYHYKGKKAEGPSRPKGVKRTISNVSMKYSGAPKRGPEWDKRMMNDRRIDVCRDVERFIKNGGK